MASIFGVAFPACFAFTAEFQNFSPQIKYTFSRIPKASILGRSDIGNSRSDSFSNTDISADDSSMISHALKARVRSYYQPLFLQF